jgi:hypothetical protein
MSVFIVYDLLGSKILTGLNVSFQLYQKVNLAWGLRHGKISRNDFNVKDCVSIVAEKDNNTAIFI